MFIQMLARRKIFITGAGGWLGTGLIGALSEGLKEWPQLRNPVNIGNLYCLANNADEASRIRQTIGANANVFIGDLRNQSDCSGFLKDASESVLIHTAGIIHPSRVRDFYAINRDGTLNLLEAAIEVGVYRAVVISSNSPLGVNRRNDHVFDETSPFNPYMHYGRSKMEMEQGVDRLRSRDLDAVIIRAPWFYGPHQPARQTRFFEMIRDGKFPIVGSGQNRRSMAYIDNLCAGILLAAVKPVARNQTYWIADARPYTMQEIVETVQEQLDAKGIKTARKQFHLPGIVSSFAFLADKTIQSLGFYNQAIHVASELNKNIACTIAKSQRELGFDPVIDLKEGMQRSIDWCLENNLLRRS